ncbi:hypothetical protein FBU30_010111 [Linnemannia zychae]|nr:hypothetical protein FBU30_010111 [Linnemannia zychae]
MRCKLEAIPAEEKEQLQTYQGSIRRHAIAFFETHGHHVRYFSNTWHILHEAASLSGSKCTNLISLDVKDLWGYDPTLLAVPVTEDENDFILYLQQYWKSPLIPILDPDEVPEEIDRHEMNRFWLLVHRNPSLVQLKVPFIEILDYFSQDFYVETFSRMRYLKELNLKWLSIDINVVLNALPQLERLKGYRLDELENIQQTHNNLRYLKHEEIEIPVLINLMRHLPNLEELDILSLHLHWMTFELASQIVSETEQFPQLKTFIIESYFSYQDDEFYALVVRLFPGLVRIVMQSLPLETKMALWKHCFDLEDIDVVDGKDSEVIRAWEERREQDSYPQKYNTEKHKQ